MNITVDGTAMVCQPTALAQGVLDNDLLVTIGGAGILLIGLALMVIMVKRRKQLS